MTPILTPTRTGVLVTFPYPPRHSSPPAFCKDHPAIVDDKCKAALTFDDPIGPVLGRLWMSNGNVYSVRPVPQPEPEDDDEELAA